MEKSEERITAGSKLFDITIWEDPDWETPV
jgi:hypothetical protein